MAADAPDFHAAQALLRDLNFAITNADFTPQALGSWSITATGRNTRLRIIWDGQDRALVIQRPKLHGCGDGWRDAWPTGRGRAHDPFDLEQAIGMVLNAADT